MSRSRLSQRVTGGPSLCLSEWKRIGAGQRELRWLEQETQPDGSVRGGATIDRVAEVATADVVQHQEGAAVTHREWTQACVDEETVLGVVECYPPGRGASLNNKMDVVPKSGYDAEHEDDRDRLRLVLNNRPANESARDHPFRMETLETARPMFRRGRWMVGFDLQHGYNHFIMAEAEREHLGFQWGWWPEGTQPVPGGRFTGRRIPRMYRYRALPFGCKSSPFIFTALMQVVLDYLREMGVEVMGYIDDFWAVCDTREQAERVRLFMLHTFAALGLAVNLEKSTPAPVQQAVVLGTAVDLVAHTFAVTPKKQRSIATLCDELVAAATAGRSVMVRQVASVTGKVMACRIAVGNIAHRQTRALFAVITAATGLPPSATFNFRLLRALWREPCVLSHEAVAELRLWRRCIGHIPPMPIDRFAGAMAVFGGAPHLFQDAGSHAFAGAWLAGGHQWRRMRGALAWGQHGLQLESSTCREIDGIRRTLLAFERPLASERVVYFFTDSWCAYRALERGSSTPVIQRMARRVHAWALAHGIDVRVRWMRRSTGPIKLCDLIGRRERVHDYRIASEAFRVVDAWWGPHRLDVMAQDVHSAVTQPFFSRYHTWRSAGVDCFARRWGADRVWCFPARAIIGRAVAHARAVQAWGTFVLPWWPGALWWPWVAEGATGVVAHWRWAAQPNLLFYNGRSVTMQEPLLFVSFDFRQCQ